MRLALLQLASRGDAPADLRSLLAAVSAACDAGAEVVVCPRVPSIMDDDEARLEFAAHAEGCPPEVALLVPFGVAPRGRELTLEPTPLGRTLQLYSDECIDPALFGPMEELAPDAVVWRPDAESPLQAEAIVELAQAASRRFAGLVVVSSLAGGEAGFGDSAAVYLGDVLVEGLDGEEVLIADVPSVPAPRPEPPAPRPELPPILRQRLAVHRGEKAPVTWPSDMY